MLVTGEVVEAELSSVSDGLYSINLHGLIRWFLSPSLILSAAHWRQLSAEPPPPSPRRLSLSDSLHPHLASGIGSRKYRLVSRGRKGGR